VPEESFFWILWCERGYQEADTLTIWVGTTLSGLISNPPPSFPPIFTPHALPAATLPIYPGLGQAQE